MNSSRVVCIIQARLTSTRFPRKVLEKIGGRSMIARVCDAARGAEYVDKVVVAWAHKFPHLDENDVLGRYIEIAEREKADVVVRLTSDCPLLESWMIDEAITAFLLYGVDYYCNREKGLLDGFDVQVFSTKVLHGHGSVKPHKEHVIEPPLKLSVDTPEDLERVRRYAGE